MRRLASALAALLLLLALLGGCGGGGDETDATTGAQKQSAAEDKPAAKKQSEGKQAKSEAEEAEPADAAAKAKARQIPVGEPTPGSKAVAPGVPTTKGGDNSIQSFGSEGEAGPREEALANLLAYRDARLAGEFARACALASAELRQQLAQLIANAKTKGDTEKPKSCAETLALFTPEKAIAQLREKSQVNEVLSFRVRDDGYAYLIFKGAEGKVKFIAMADEDGQWRVNVPEPEAFSTPDRR